MLFDGAISVMRELSRRVLLRLHRDPKARMTVLLKKSRVRGASSGLDWAIMRWRGVSMTARAGNLFADVSAVSGGLKIERVISQGQASPPEFC